LTEELAKSDDQKVADVLECVKKIGSQYDISATAAARQLTFLSTTTKTNIFRLNLSSPHLSNIGHTVKIGKLLSSTM
jgi:hypothetical protein